MRRESGPPQLVRLDKAFKLASTLNLAEANLFSVLFMLGVSMVHAEQWVNNMSKAAEDEPAELESEGRQSRLGLGAKIARGSNIRPLNDPVERKLHSKINALKRKKASADEEPIPSERDGSDDDDELDSRTKAFDKKQAVPLAKVLKPQKKQK